MKHDAFLIPFLAALFFATCRTESKNGGIGWAGQGTEGDIRAALCGFAFAAIIILTIRIAVRSFKDLP